MTIPEHESTDMMLFVIAHSMTGAVEFMARAKQHDGFNYRETHMLHQTWALQEPKAFGRMSY